MVVGTDSEVIVTKIRIARDIRRVHELIREFPKLAERIPTTLPLEMDYQPTSMRVAGTDIEPYRVGLVKLLWPSLCLEATLAITPDGKRRLYEVKLRRAGPGSDKIAAHAEDILLTADDLTDLPQW